jgi:hypothetical protein
LRSSDARHYVALRAVLPRAARCRHYAAAALLLPAMRAAPPAPLRAVSFADIFFAIITIDHYYRRCLIRRFDFAIRYAD